MQTRDANDKHKKFKPYESLLRRLYKRYYKLVKRIHAAEDSKTLKEALKLSRLNRRKRFLERQIEGVESFQKGGF